MTQYISTTNCYLLKGDKVLLLHRSPDNARFPSFWMGPGGHQELGESVLDTCVRELKEETGLDGSNFRLRVVATHHYPHKDQVYLVFIFLADYIDGDPIDSKDGKLEWVNAAEAVTLEKLYPDLKVNLPTVLKDLPEVVFTRLQFNAYSEIVEAE
jgi:8-oxo-dGTP diphosphatase